MMHERGADEGDGQPQRTADAAPAGRPSTRATGIVEQRGAEDLGGGADPGERLGAAEVLGEQCADGDAARHPDPAEDLRPDERPNDLALQGRPVEPGHRWYAALCTLDSGSRADSCPLDWSGPQTWRRDVMTRKRFATKAASV